MSNKKLVLHNNNEEDNSLIIARQGHSSDRIVQSSYKSLVPSRSNFTSTQLARPSDEEINETSLKTQEALNKIVEQKISLTQLKSVAASVTSRNGATYIRYKSNSLFNNGEPMERIIKIVDKQKDPMLPPKFQIRKLPQGPPSPPPPIMHEPSKKLSLQDHKDWYIPPAISNWKNQKGFTIAIDKRMAYLNNNEEEEEKTKINENFGNLSEALEKLEQDAREEINFKNEMRLKLQERENQERELKLKELAASARTGKKGGDDSDRKYSTDFKNARQREISREERRRKAEREIKLSKLSSEQKLRSEDVSERVINNISKQKQTEPEFDSRLYQRQDKPGKDVVDDETVRTEPVQFERDELVAEKNKSFGLQDDEGPSLKKTRWD